MFSFKNLYPLIVLLCFFLQLNAYKEGNSLDEDQHNSVDQPWEKLLKPRIDTADILLNLTHGSKNNVCPGGNQTCADSYTCCLNPYGSYSCCPQRNGVCCSDHIHCCPSDSFCDTKGGKCSKKSSNLQSRNNICPGGEYQCPDHSTCCALAGGQYGCCPLENAVCCSDKLHCCPQGYTCGAGGFCQKKEHAFQGMPFEA